LTLGRDRLGVKPLFYGWAANSFLFGSELKSLRSYLDFKPAMDTSSLALFMRLGYIPAPHTIYQDVEKLPPGHILTVSSPRQRPSPRPYWSARQVVESGRRHSTHDNVANALSELEELLRDSVRLRLLADVPVGAFLSGGIDSSLIVALMRRETTAAVKTFTIGFSEATHDETAYAKSVSEHLGTEHTSLVVTAKDAAQTIPSMSAIYDEPFADPSQIPTFFVSKLARQSVTVSLSGDGGDELFGGYREYILGAKRWNALQTVAPYLRYALAAGVKRLGSLGGMRVRNLGQLLSVTTPEALHYFHASQWMRPRDLMPGVTEHASAFTDASLWPNELNETERMMYTDLVTYLPEDILTKLDRASMAVSLEARVPFLDYRVVEFAWRLPLEYKIHQGQGKRLLRLALERLLPARLF